MREEKKKISQFQILILEPVRRVENIRRHLLDLYVVSSESSHQGGPIAVLHAQIHSVTATQSSPTSAGSPRPSESF